MNYGDIMIINPYDNLDKNEIFKGLLAYGLFSEKLPPIFSGASFYEYCVKENTDGFNNNSHNYVQFESIRNNNVPRQLGVPNPIAYYHLCKCISDNWVDLKTYFKNKISHFDYKVSRVTIRKMQNQEAIFKMNYHNWRLDGEPVLDLMLGKKYEVEADISTCFPSIYTHSIPWAILGKAEAKKNTRSTNMANEIDRTCRNIKNQETKGLLIGPHASNILSEIILCDIDCKLYAKGWKYLRYIDDYKCYVDSEEQGKKFLKDLQKYLRGYELILNAKKTNIIRLPKCQETEWIREIRSYDFATRCDIDYRYVQVYLDKLLRLYDDSNGNASVFLFAIKQLMTDDNLSKMSTNAKIYCEKVFMHYAFIYPYLIPCVEEYIFQKLEVPEERIKNYVNLFWREAETCDNVEGMYYVIFWALKHNVLFENFCLDNILDKCNCILNVLAWIYCQSFKMKDNMRKLKEYAEELSKDAFDENWLFVYEVLSVNSLSNEWKKLKEKKVSFLVLQ